jgi:hypothetical protein
MAEPAGGNSQDAPLVSNSAGATAAAPVETETLAGSHRSLQQSQSTNLERRQAIFELGVVSPCLGLAATLGAVGHVTHGGPSTTEQPSPILPRLEKSERSSWLMHLCSQFQN